MEVNTGQEGRLCGVSLRNAGNRCHLNWSHILDTGHTHTHTRCGFVTSESDSTHMYPTQRDEIILVLYEEEFLLIFCVTIIWPTALLGYNDVGHCEGISCLEKKHIELHGLVFSRLVSSSENCSVMPIKSQKSFK